MEHKVLVADDSLTIQKVIKITLANEPFELHECAEASGLSEAVEKLRPSMVLLDFNLSESKTGYDLTREIKAASPNTGVLMLFGTFDTIDEELLADCGCAHHIVKPFDGTKFINLCRSLAEDYESGGEESDASSAKMPLSEDIAEKEIVEEDDEEDDEEEWVVNQPVYEEADEEEQVAASIPEPINQLESDIEEWGMEVPAVIGASEEEEVEIPGVIEASGEEEDASLPGSEDLEYPQPKSKLVPLDELNPAEADSVEQEKFVSAEGTDTEEGVRNLEEQIQDELEEEHDLWAADIVEEISEKESMSAAEKAFKAWRPDEADSVEVEDLEPVKPHNLREVVEEDIEPAQVPSDFPEDVMLEKAQPAPAVETQAASKEDLERIQEEIERELASQLGPLVEKFVKEFCKDQIEKVAWEVIPDLAENIIKKEIKKISDSVMD